MNMVLTERISLTQTTEDAPYSQEYLSLVARKGCWEAIKFGRVWLTTCQSVVEYRASMKDKNS